MKSASIPLVPRSLRLSFVMVTSLFVLWGFANDITNPMVAAFKNVLLLTHFESSLVQAAFYGGYCIMAIPAALFIRKYTYKSGILMGLSLYALGCFLFIPAGYAQMFGFFLCSYLIMTCGLAFLETTSNPYILSMGDDATAARRLNLAQSFNPMGSLMGMFVAREFILGRLNPTTEAQRIMMQTTYPEGLAAIKEADLAVIVLPYALLGGAVLLALIIFSLAKLPDTNVHEETPSANNNVMASVSRLFHTPRYIWGVVAQMFYVGVQIMVWTFIIQYGVNELKLEASVVQSYNIGAMILFVCSRFVCTWLLKFIQPGKLLALLSVGGGALVLCAIFLEGMAGLYSLVAVSGCMSLMFPTIYGIALTGLGDDAKLGSAGLIFAIVGGCVMPPLQALIMDGNGLSLGAKVLSATRTSFFLPFLCFVVVGIYGLVMWKTRATEKALETTEA